MANKSKFLTKQLESQILSIVNTTLLRDIYDPIIKLCSFTAVKLTNDNLCAKIYVDSFNRDKVEYIVKKLNEANGVFRTAVAKNLKKYKAPIIKFEKDMIIDESNKIEKLIHDMKQGD